MKRKQSSSDRGFGQLPLPSSFRFKSLSGEDSSKEEGEVKASKKSSSISLSDFLNRKLGGNCSNPKKIQSKEKPFMGIKSTDESIDNKIIGTKREARDLDSLLGEGMLKVFSHSKREEGHGEEGSGIELEGSTNPNEQDFSKQSNPFRVSSFSGGNGRGTTQKHIVVIGDDPKPKQKRKQENLTRNKRPKLLYNHYANGGGWWDCDMEGVDNQEVGCNESWEGMGSTTLGGLEWH